MSATFRDLHLADIATNTDQWAGLCVEQPEMWDDYHDDGIEGRIDRTNRHRLAVSICHECPLIVACGRALAAQSEPAEGVWAGKLIDRDYRRQHPTKPSWQELKRWASYKKGAA